MRNVSSFWNRATRWRTLPLLVCLVGIAASFAVWMALRANWRTHVRLSTHLEAESIRNEIFSRIEFRVESLREIGETLRNLPIASGEVLRLEAASLGGPYLGFRSISIFDGADRIRDGIGSTQDGPALLGQASLKDLWEKARAGRRPYGGFARLGESTEELFVVFVPVFDRENYLGSVVGVFGVEKLFKIILPDSFAPNYGFALSEGTREFFRRRANDDNTEPHGVELGFPVYHSDWQLRVWPTPDGLAYSSSWLPEWIFLLGVLLAVLLAYVLLLLQAAQRRAEDLRREIEIRQGAEHELKSVNENLEGLVAERTRSVGRYAEELSRSNQELEQFAFIVSHDLKEPLRMVASYVRLLQRQYRGKLDSQADEYIEFAVNGAKRMSELIDALLRYSRVGRSDLVAQPVNTAEVVETVLRSLQPALQEKNATVNVGKMPLVNGDAALISLLFQNLISNAIKFTESASPEVWVDARRDGDGWHFSVRDNGIGLDPKDAERIFVIFQRLHRSQKFPGTGIGLAVCKKIVERHQGRIWVESRPGEGAVFHFTLPAV